MCYQSRHYARLLLLRLLPAPASTYLLSRLELLSALQTHVILAFDNIELDLQEHIRTTSRRYFNSQDHKVFDDRWFWQHVPLITYMKNSWLSLDITITLPVSSLEVSYQSALLSNQVNDFRDILVWGQKSSTNKMHQDSNRKVYLEMAYAQSWTYNFSGIFKIHDLQERLKTTFRASDHLSSWKGFGMDPSNSWWAIGDYPAWLKARCKHTRSSYVTHIELPNAQNCSKTLAPNEVGKEENPTKDDKPILYTCLSSSYIICCFCACMAFVHMIVKRSPCASMSPDLTSLSLQYRYLTLQVEQFELLNWRFRTSVLSIGCWSSSETKISNGRSLWRSSPRARVSAGGWAQCLLNPTGHHQPSLFSWTHWSGTGLGYLPVPLQSTGVHVSHS